MHLRKNIVLLLLAFSLLLSSCEDADADIFIDLALDWAHEKGLLACSDPNASPPDCDEVPTSKMTAWIAGEIADEAAKKVPGVIGDGIQTISNIFTKDNQLDPGAEAVLDTAKVAKDINDADTLAADGFENNDPSKIEEAIKLRPNDWAYQEQLWAYYAATRDQKKMGEIGLDSDNLVIDHVNATIQAEQDDPDFSDAKQLQICKTTVQNQYIQRESALLAQIDKADLGENVEFLVSQVELVRSKMKLLADNSPRSTCAPYH